MDPSFDTQIIQPALARETSGWSSLRKSTIPTHAKLVALTIAMWRHESGTWQFTSCIDGRHSNALIDGTSSCMIVMSVCN